MSRQPRTAIYGEVLDYADQALAAERGIEVELDMPRHATNLRMRFYARREELRDQGETKYDNLSVTIKRNKVVVFEKKAAMAVVKEL